MIIENEFVVSLPINEAWELLTDLEGIAPCLPGAQLTSREGDVFKGKIKIKVGPVTSEYSGTAKFAEKDDAAYLAIIDAKGRDSRGAGNASAMITAQLREEGGATAVSISTDLKVSGKVAQFGRGIMADVSKKLLGQFVECLEAKLASGSDSDGPGSSTTQTTSSTSEASAEPEALDLMGLAGSAVTKRLLPLVAGVVVVAGVIWYLVA